MTIVIKNLEKRKDASTDNFFMPLRVKDDLRVEFIAYEEALMHHLSCTAYCSYTAHARHKLGHA